MRPHGNQPETHRRRKKTIQMVHNKARKQKKIRTMYVVWRASRETNRLNGRAIKKNETPASTAFLRPSAYPIDFTDGVFYDIIAPFDDPAIAIGGGGGGDRDFPFYVCFSPIFVRFAGSGRRPSPFSRRSARRPASDCADLCGRCR